MDRGFCSKTLAQRFLTISTAVVFLTHSAAIPQAATLLRGNSISARGLKQVFPIVACGNNSILNYCILGGGAVLGNASAIATTFVSTFIPNGDNIGAGGVVVTDAFGAVKNDQNQTTKLDLTVAPVYGEYFNTSLAATGAEGSVTSTTKEGDGTLIGGSSDDVKLWGNIPAGAAAGKPTINTDYLPGYFGASNQIITGNAQNVTSVSSGIGIPDGVYANHPDAGAVLGQQLGL